MSAVVLSWTEESMREREREGIVRRQDKYYLNKIITLFNWIADTNLIIYIY